MAHKAAHGKHTHHTMDDSQQSVNPIPQSPASSRVSPHRTMIGITTIITSFLFILIVLNYFSIIPLYRWIPSLPQRNAPADKIVAKAGRENIYQKDLDTLMSFRPDKNNAEGKKFFLANLINDSLILQGAKDDLLTDMSLDNTIFNSPNKDLMKRAKVVQQVKTDLAQKTDRIEGQIISIWFIDNQTDQPGKLGLAKSKELAYVKISKIYNQVKNGTLTMEQAAQQIRSDKSLLQIDGSYETNAFFTFTATEGQSITFDKEFDKVLWSLKEGQISDLLVAKVYDELTQRYYERLYHFAKITKKVQNGKIKDFESWLKAKKETYAVAYY